MAAPLGVLGRLHTSQRRWHPALRALWWLPLLPLALACWASALRLPVARAGGWVLAGLVLLLYVGAATGPSQPSRPVARSGPHPAAPTPPPDVPPASTAASSPGPTTAQPVDTATAVPPTAVPPTAVPPTAAQPAAVPSAAVPPASVPPAPVPPASVPPVQAPPALAAPPPPPSSASPRRTAPSQAVVAPPPPSTPGDEPPAAHGYATCAELNGAYPHGVGMPAAVDHVRGSTRPVTTFTRDADLYEANAARDRDGDGIACEQ